MTLLRCTLLFGLLGCTPNESDTDTSETDVVSSTDTWVNFGESFMATYCVECHSGNGKDFRRYSRVVVFAEASRCGVSPNLEDGCSGFPPPAQFPVGSGPMPTDEERLRFVAWIDAGLPEGR